MQRKNSTGLLNVISVAVLLLAVVALVIRFGPPKTHFQTKNLLLFATGDVHGCSLWDVWDPLEADLYEKGLDLRKKVKLLQTDGSLELLDTPFGPIWTPPGNDLLILLAEYSVDIYGSGSEGFQEGAVVLDCGANVGTFARLAFNQGAARVVAVEPSPLNIEALRHNFAEEIDAGKFILVPKAVWNEPGEMELNLYDLSVLDSLVMQQRHAAPRKSAVQVELTTIDSIVDEFGLERLDFIKMDIEGAERQALEGATETLRRFRPRLSIATENLVDDIDAVPAAVLAAVPDYKIRNGRCINIDSGVLRPAVVSFEPREQR